MTSYIFNLFDPAAGTTTTADVLPVISIDGAERLATSITQLQEALGISEMTPLPVGSVVNVYKYTKTNAPAQVAEGEEIGLTQYKRTIAKAVRLAFAKYRKRTTGEAIQQSGQEAAVNKTDRLVINEARNGILDGFFSMITTGATVGEAVTNSLQAAMATAWAGFVKHFDGYDAEPVWFIHPDDAAKYLATAPISLQTVFGMEYIENFMGRGRTFITPRVTSGRVFVTAAQNINGVYIPVNSEAMGFFGYTADETGLVGVKHVAADAFFSVETYVTTAAGFYVEDATGVIAQPITYPSASASNPESH